MKRQDRKVALMETQGREISFHSQTQQNADRYLNLSQKHPVMRVNAPTWQLNEEGSRLDLTFHFEIEGLAPFHPKASFYRRGNGAAFLNHEHLHRYADHFQAIFRGLSLVEALSYWKSCCPPLIEYEGPAFTPEEEHFWSRLYYAGLGEFRYRNGIEVSQSTFLKWHFGGDGELSSDLKSSHQISGLSSYCPTQTNAVLIPVGGGKDSVVTLELLKNQPCTRYAFVINPSQASLDCIRETGIEDEFVLQVERHLDPQLFELNRQNYLNGHVPVSAVIAHYACLSAMLQGIPYIALSNESSADQSSVQGTEVNHQWSKSLEFEHAFSQHIKAFYAKDIHYFSLLRPFSELAIAKRFCAYPNYHRIFRSCNLGSKAAANRWCGHCAKCLFVYIMLLAFLGEKKSSEIIGRSMLEAEELMDDFERLIGLIEVKPFECVGTPEETCYALARFEASLSDNERKELYKRAPLYRRYVEAKQEGCLKLDAVFESQCPDHIPSLFRPALAAMEEDAKNERLMR